MTKWYQSKCSPWFFIMPDDKKSTYVVLTFHRKVQFWSFLIAFQKCNHPLVENPKFFLSSMSYCWRNIYQLKLWGRDYSFRNECSFRISWYLFLIHIKWQILRNFYWVAPNYYHVFFIPLTPPFINFHHLSVLPVVKIARCKNLA